MNNLELIQIAVGSKPEALGSVSVLFGLDKRGQVWVYYPEAIMGWKPVPMTVA